MGGRRGSLQAAEAVRAVEAAGGARSDSPTPIENFVSKLTGRSSISKDKEERASFRDSVASLKGAESLKGQDETAPGSSSGSAIVNPEEEAATPENGGGGSKKIKKSKKKGKK